MDNKNKNYIDAVGRRKESVAKVRLYSSNYSWGDNEIKKGEIFVNQKNAESYFGKGTSRIYLEPFVVTKTEDKFAITVKAQGGGKKGQLEATVMAIARALDKHDREKFHTLLKRQGLLTRDPRAKERRKVGMGGKSRRKKQSPKR